MGLFSHKCPQCGGKLEATGWSFPYPTHRCPNCIRVDKQNKKIEELERKMEELQSKSDSGDQ